MLQKTYRAAIICTRSNPNISSSRYRTFINYNCLNLGSLNIRKFSNNPSVNSQKLNENVIPFKIIPCHEFRNLCGISGSNVELDDIEIKLGQEEFILNLTSLRDFCFCPLCMHPSSRQKLFIAKDFKLDKFSIEEIRALGDCKDMQIRWSDGHESVYSIDLLRKIKKFTNSPSSIYKSKQVNYEYPSDDYYKSLEELDCKPEAWDVDKITKSVSIIDYRSLIGESSSQYDNKCVFNANKTVIDPDGKQLDAMYRLSKSLVTYGLAKIINVPQREQEVLNVTRCLAYERPTGYGTIFDVVVEPSDEINLAYSANEFDLHTDLPYRESMPGVQLLHCITNSQDGGESYFSDGYTAAKKLQERYPELFHVITNFPTTFSVRDPYRDVKFRRQFPIVSLDYHGDVHEIHYSPFHLPPLGPRDDVKLFYLALDKFTHYLQSTEQKLITKMEPGELYIFHNRRVLHGRSSYDPAKSRRFLQGCYMDWDEIKALYEKLHARVIKLADIR